MKNKPYFLLSGIILLFPFNIDAQKASEEGQEILKVYANYEHGLTEADKSTAFEIRRVYLGYKKPLDEYFTAEVKLDIGSPEDLSQYSLIRRYAYFKTAALSYSRDRVQAWFGLFDMQQFKVQEDFWGYRYIYKSYMDEYKFGPSADIGAGISYQLSKLVSADLVISNGEGYKSLQADDTYKTGIGITLKPYSGLLFRAYYDYIHIGALQSTFAGFCGYSNERFRVAGEYIFRTNQSFLDKHHLYGYSVYGTWIFSEKIEAFARYDRLNSNIFSNESLPWNLYNDGSAIISGIQYQPASKVKFALNYQDWFPFAANAPNTSYIYLNLEFKI